MKNLAKQLCQRYIIDNVCFNTLNHCYKNYSGEKYAAYRDCAHYFNRYYDYVRNEFRGDKFTIQAKHGIISYNTFKFNYGVVIEVFTEHCSCVKTIVFTKECIHEYSLLLNNDDNPVNCNGRVVNWYRFEEFLNSKNC